jgi:hypothetical protein
MYRSLFLTISGVYCLLIGLSFLLVPQSFASLYGVSHLDSPAVVLARYFGHANIALGVLWFMSRSLTEPATVRIILLPAILAYAMGVLLSLLSLADGTVPTSALILIDLIFRIGMTGWAVWCYASIRKP